MEHLSYEYYKAALNQQHLPLAFVDLDLLRKNASYLVSRSKGLPIRIASKSVRTPGVLKLVLKEFPQFQGIMTYSASETAFLCEQGLDNFLIGYRTVDQSDIDQACHWIAKGKTIIFMIDCPSHCDVLGKAAKRHGVVTKFNPAVVVPLL